MLYFILAAGMLAVAVTAIPIGIGLAIVGLAILHFVAGDAAFLAVNAAWNNLTSFTLSAVPLFIFMGELMLVSGVSSRIYNAISPFFYRIPGQLLHTNIAVSTLFGAVSGASTSTAAAVGSVVYPELQKRGYKKSILVGSLAAGGTLGLLIPPSLALLLYGATQQVSIGRLFLAGLVPGVMLAFMFMSYIAICSRKASWEMPEVTPVKLDRQVWMGLLKIWPVLFIIFSVLGTIYLGIATPTEAAGLGVLASVILGFLWGDLTLRKTWKAFVDSALVFVTIGTVMFGAIVLAQAVSVIGVPYQVLASITSMELSPYMVLFAVCAMYLVLGCFFDGISLMLMTLPVVFPVLSGLGFDPIWLGVVITIMIEVGMLTPPVGMNIYVLSGITGNQVTITQAAKAAFPYWLLLLVGIFILTLFPAIATFLPTLMYG